jgi:hypothetical protein
LEVWGSAIGERKVSPVNNLGVSQDPSLPKEGPNAIKEEL